MEEGDLLLDWLTADVAESEVEGAVGASDVATLDNVFLWTSRKQMFFDLLFLERCLDCFSSNFLVVKVQVPQ